MKRETRYFQFEDIRAEDGDKGRILRGHAAVFEKLTQPMGWIEKFREKIARGAFANSIKNDDVRALWSHNIDYVLGRTSNNTLTLREDDKGLAFDLDLPDTQWGRDAYTLIKRGDVTGMSFGFSVKADEWVKGEEGKPHIRTLKEIKLYEISPTAFPAYEQTDVSARDIDKMISDLERSWAEEERKAEDGGLSLADAQARLVRAVSWRPRR